MTTVEFIKKALHEHLVIVLLIAVIAPFTTVSLVSLFFPVEREIVYDFHKVFADCGFSRTPGKECTALYEMIIGNTGTREEALRLVWPVNLSAWERGKRILNIAADQPRDHDPQFSCETGAMESACVIDNLAPGAMMILNFTCLACSSRDTGMLEENAVTVQTAADISRGDPRVTTVFRRLQNLLNLIL